ncbi:MAG: hypothetical protein JRC57_07585 [Deltaproteobacteria bacterium]|nr:hypothetical protein [Deltaproteobacteria bacterium]
MSDKWIRCIECNEVTHVTDYDCSPQYQFDEKLEEVIEKPMDDMRNFMVQHRHHKIEELSRIKDSFISEGAYVEPLKVSYFEATNGKERFVIKKWRDDINDPLQYELISGYIKTTISLEVQLDEIRKQLRDEIKHPSITETKIERFIQIIEKVASQFSAGDKIEITAETDTPLISYCKMDTDFTREILRLSGGIFSAEELKEIEQFIYRNNNDNEPMTLLLKRAFTIEEENSKLIELGKEESHLDKVVSQRTY